MILHSADTCSRNSDTFMIVSGRDIAEDVAYRKWMRIRDVNQMLKGFLKEYKEVPLEIWNAMIALTEKCELSLNAIYERGEDMLERWNEGGHLKSYPRD